MTSDHRTPPSNAIASRLRALHDDAAAPYEWAEFKRRWKAKRRPQWHRAAIAAAFALVVVSVALWSRFGAGNYLAQALDSTPSDSAPAVSDARNIAAERATTQWLASLPKEPAIVRVGTRGAVVDLEDHIAWIDDLLSAAQVESVQPAHIQTLQRERAHLIDSLAQVRYAETLAAGVQ